MRIIKENILIKTFYNFLIYYPTPSNITYFWNFGFLAGLCLIIQILTGITLTMHYTPNVLMAFTSVEHIMRDVNYGWLLRYIHANGASMFFIIVYLHMFRGLYYGSYIFPRQLLWSSGAIIYLVMTATAFMGYVLPWGQMSFWGATVITSLFGALPLIGGSIVYWLWGGFSVDNPTLNKLFSLHYLLPFVIVGIMILHFVFLHENGSNNPLGIISRVDQIAMTPYSLIKDFYSLFVFLIFFSVFIFYMPNLLGHPDNYIPGNPMATPAHIVPEWYLLPMYAILRSIPSKLGGVVAMACALIIIIIVPFFLKFDIRSAAYKPIYRFLFWLFLCDCVLLGWIGGNAIKYPYYEVGQIATLFYFMYFIICLPLCNYIEFIMWNEFFNKNHPVKFYYKSLYFENKDIKEDDLIGKIIFYTLTVIMVNYKLFVLTCDVYYQMLKLFINDGKKKLKSIDIVQIKIAINEILEEIYDIIKEKVYYIRKFVTRENSRNLIKKNLDSINKFGKKKREQLRKETQSFLRNWLKKDKIVEDLIRKQLERIFNTYILSVGISLNKRLPILLVIFIHIIKIVFFPVFLWKYRNRLYTILRRMGKYSYLTRGRKAVKKIVDRLRYYRWKYMSPKFTVEQIKFSRDFISKRLYKMRFRKMERYVAYNYVSDYEGFRTVFFTDYRRRFGITIREYYKEYHRTL